MPRAAPPPEVAVRLLHERFVGRRDLVAVLAPWGKPCPASPGDSLDALLRAHVLGTSAPPAAVTLDTRRRGRIAERGRFRVGSYAPDPERRTKWLCLDFDGHGHSHALADPAGAVRRAHRAFHEAGLPAHVERSGGGNGWHLWCFFDPPILAEDAIRIGRFLAPRDCPLERGGVADTARCMGIELFPKQASLGPGGLGNMVWLPWWSGARAPGANLFHRPDGDLDGPFVPYAPAELATAPTSALGAVLGLALAREREGHDACGRKRDVPARTSVPAQPSWKAWRVRALAALPLEGVYGPWLSGGTSGRGWLTCRDPESPSGDASPSAGIADGLGEAERGSFHSFRSGTTLSVFDFLVRHGGCVDFRAACARVADLSRTSMPAPSPPAGWDPTDLQTAQPPRRCIFVTTDEHEVIEQAIAALATVPDLYARNGTLVQIIRGARRLGDSAQGTAAPRIVPVGLAGIRERLTRGAIWMAESRDKVRAVHPPGWAAPEIEARRQWQGIRPLEGVIEAPALRSDGSIVCEPGYDPGTGLYYEARSSQPFPAVPEHPSREQCRAAADQLLDLVCDFPFAKDAHRSAWLAGLLTPLARPAFAGPAPLFLVDANVRGVGKTKLVDVISEIVQGREMEVCSPARNEDEEAKRITATLINGNQLVLIDNVEAWLGSAALNVVLTGRMWTDRILGKSEMVSVPLLATWYATGNNVSLKQDTTRRCLPIRIDSDLERPEHREGFKYPALIAHVRAQRPALLVAALTLLRGYLVAGRPDVKLAPWGSYEEWSSLVRGAIVWCGLEDPFAGRVTIETNDEDAANLADLLAGWDEMAREVAPETRGVTAAAALRYLDQSPSRFQRLFDAIGAICPGPPGRLPSARQLGNRLAKYRGRVCGGRKLEQLPPRQGERAWTVRGVDSAAQ